MASPLVRPTEAPPPHDVRARRPGLDALVLLHRGRRLLSALVLVVLDLTGVTLALYAALVLRNAYRGEEVLFGLPWAAISNWLQFIALVLVLVFARAGLYRQREARPGADAVIRSLALVTLITAFYAVAVAGMTFHSFYGIFWVTFVLAAIARAAAARELRQRHARADAAARRAPPHACSSARSASCRCSSARCAATAAVPTST